MKKLLLILSCISCQISASNLTDYQIVFDSKRSGYQEIHLMNADGSNPSQITHRKNRMVDHDARWIPGEDRVGFQSYRGRGWRIWTIGIDGKSPKMLTDYGNYEGEPHWSVNSDEIVFTAYRPAMNLMVVDKEGKVLRQLTHNKNYDVLADHPRWSSNGENITYISNVDGDFEIFTMDKVGGNVKQLTFNQSADFSPSFSPSGDSILYLSDEAGQFDTYILNLKNGSKKRISHNPNESSQQYKAEFMEGSSTFRSLAPSWSPDGKWIAYFCYIDNNAEICIADNTGRFVKRITTNKVHDGAPSWRLKKVR